MNEIDKRRGGEKMINVRIALTGIFALVAFSLLLSWMSSQAGNGGLTAVFILFALVVVLLFFFTGKGGGGK